MSRYGPEWWETISPHLDAALDMTGAERTAWLAALRAQNPTIADHVAALLDEHVALTEEGFLDHGAPGLGWASARGSAIGAYTLVEPIGEGGMGTVWLAERRDGEIRGHVAVKLLGAAGRRPAWRQRFMRERQLLASLHHPAIVQAIDAGHTPEGVPFLVMEYVDGTPIDVYANGRSVTERLQLFVRVCDGVAYAHRRLIIHRDLKPSNILVDATGQPKLLDFGIAKLLDESGDPTRTIERLLTPKYASPEQFQGAAQTTATDIYSLGAVLYTLVTGRSPHEGDGATASTADLITGAKPIPPASQVNPDLPSDLDYILRKSLRHEPDERYASVDAFSADIRALLESRPVEARLGDRWYRARTFLMRYRVAVSAGALVMLSLSAGLYLANRERVIAERRFQQVRQLANTFIGLDVPLRNVPGATAVRNRIVSESLGYLEGLGREARGDPDLSLEIGAAYLRVGEVQGVPLVANLGQYPQAEESLRKADAFVDTVLSARPSNRQAWLTSAEIHRAWMALVDYQDRRADTLMHAAKAAAQLDHFLSLGPAAPADINTATLIYSNVATAYDNSNRYDEAIRYCRRALAISDGVAAAEMRRASVFGVLSVSLREGTGDLAGALTAAENSRALLEKLAASGGRNELYNLHLAHLRVGLILGEDEGISLHRPADAVAAFQRAIDITQTLVRKDSNDSSARIALTIASSGAADILRHTDPGKALTIYDAAREQLHALGANSRSRYQEAALLSSSSYASRALHREDDAKRRINEALGILRDLKAYPADAIEPDTEVYGAVKALADDYADTAQTEKAIDVYSDLVTKMAASRPNLTKSVLDAFYVSKAWGTLAVLLRRAGRAADADALVQKQTELWTGWGRRYPASPFIQQQIASIRR